MEDRKLLTLSPFLHQNFGQHCKRQPGCKERSRRCLDHKSKYFNFHQLQCKSTWFSWKILYLPTIVKNTFHFLDRVDILSCKHLSKTKCHIIKEDVILLFFSMASARATKSRKFPQKNMLSLAILSKVNQYTSLNVNPNLCNKQEK